MFALLPRHLQALPSSVIVFFVGGVTYEEMGIAQDIEDGGHGGGADADVAGGGGGGGGKNPGCPVIVGGSCVLNSSEYLLSLTKLEQRLSGDSL